MTKVLLGLFLVFLLAVPVHAEELAAPEVPSMGLERMPHNTASFPEGVWELLGNSRELLQSEFDSALETGFCVIGTTMLLSLLHLLSERIRGALSLAGAAVMASVMVENTNVMIACAADAVYEICEYGKLLCPVMTMALAAQGGISASAGLYVGTTVFITLLSMLISKVLLPMVSVYLAFSVSRCALDNEMMKSICDALKTAMSWLLKTVLIAFTTYMSVTGVVSGTTDAAALKAAKVTISSVVPVVGGILSDASETVLISMGVVKNTAGVYGILAVLAVFVGPFIKVGAQYLVLKISAGICSIFGEKNLTTLILDISTAMGLLLAMVSSGCILVFISTVCFMKGIG